MKVRTAMLDLDVPNDRLTEDKLGEHHVIKSMRLYFRKICSLIHLTCSELTHQYHLETKREDRSEIKYNIFYFTLIPSMLTLIWEINQTFKMPLNIEK